MKRSFMAISIMGLFLLGSIAHAATIVYSPSSATLTIPAGASRTILEIIGIENIESGKTYFTWSLDTVHGSLPRAWITSSPGTTFLTETSPSLGVTYTIAVPDGTPSGTYAGYVYAKAMAAHRYADIGGGIYVQVTVPSHCSGIPKFINMTISPDTIWPPNRKMDMVTVTGSVDYPAGCALLNFGYSIVDEYGIYTSTGHATVGANRDFSFAIPVEAWREGTDKDGRHYQITVFAEDEAGMAISETLTAIVPHDQRKK
jgi:hypothetical protein